MVRAIVILENDCGDGGGGGDGIMVVTVVIVILADFNRGVSF